MNNNLISKENNVAKFELVFTPEEFEAAIIDAYKKNKDKFRIDGFRKGKAPRKIIENMYGQDIFYDEALNALLGTAYPEALTALDLEVINQPKLEVGEIDKTKDITITAEVELFPEVEVKNYVGLKIDEVKSEVTDQDVENDLLKIQKSQARLETVEDRASEKDDTVVIDFDGSIDGVPFDGGKAENYELRLGSGMFIPGFEDQLIGKNAGDEVDVVVTFPENYGAAELAGKEAHFATKIHEIKKEVLPEIDDDLASDVSEYETLDEFKEELRSNLVDAAAKRDEDTMKNQLLDRLREENEVEVPAVMVQDELDRMIQEMNQQLTYQGMNIQSYLQMVGQTMEDLRNSAREDAEKRVALRILLRGVINQENIEATEEEIRKELEEFAKNYGQTVEQVKKMIGEDNLSFFADDIKTRKAVDFMYEKAVKEPKAADAE